MDDDTHAHLIRPGVSHSVAVELPALMREFPFYGFGRRIESLAALGDRVLAEARPWAGSIRALLDEFEAALKPHRLSDEAHRVMEIAVGVDRLYELLNELCLIAEPNP